MEWTSLKREELEEMIVRGLETADDAVQAAWHAMRIEPERWQCSPWADQLGGFWVVAEKDGRVIWYNEIEEGFNTSKFVTRGTIDEYWCNQTTFEGFLLSLPEAREAENWCQDTAASIVPSELQSGGTIIRRQTTYWTLRTDGGSIWRLHFKSKAETKFLEPRFSKLEIVHSHPILVHYIEPWAELYYTGDLSKSAKLIDALGERVSAASDGWRSLKEYWYQAIDLNRGYGLLMQAPMSIVQLTIAELSKTRIKMSVVKCLRPTGNLGAAIMGRNVIVAEGFRFDQDHD